MERVQYIETTQSPLPFSTYLEARLVLLCLFLREFIPSGILDCLPAEPLTAHERFQEVVALPSH